jgi:hypothetical protein
MAGKILVLAPLLLLLTACQHQQILPVAHAAGSEEYHSPVQSEQTLEPTSLPQTPRVPTDAHRHHLRRAAKEMHRPGLHDSCYAYILLRPKVQRATAVQARLDKADAIEAAFGAQTVDVDLVGDHANIMALQFPAVWPDYAYAARVSSIIEDYLSTPDVLDYMCNSGFAEVRLSARGSTDGKMHLLWTAKITAEGLVKTRHAGVAPLGQTASE